MKGILGVSLLILLMPTAHAAALPGDSAEGKRLHDANCMGCHDTSVFTRKDRLVQSLDALKKQLASCTHMAKKILRERNAGPHQVLERSVLSFPLSVTAGHIKLHRIQSPLGRQRSFSSKDRAKGIPRLCFLFSGPGEGHNSATDCQA